MFPKVKPRDKSNEPPRYSAKGKKPDTTHNISCDCIHIKSPEKENLLRPIIDKWFLGLDVAWAFTMHGRE